tara:strand:- start:284 stop:496 length:213 start_codon:yes stop_codon:yes gene_type:complete
MKRLVVKLGDVQGTEVEVNDNENASLTEKEINDMNNQLTPEKHSELKASAKAKLVAGEPLTEAEADTLVI